MRYKKDSKEIFERKLKKVYATWWFIGNTIEHAEYTL